MMVAKQPPKGKLAFSIFRYRPTGGLSRDFRQVVTECIQRGFEVVIYTMQWHGQPLEGCDVQVVPVSGWTNHHRSQAFATAVFERLQRVPCDALIGFNRMPGLDFYFAGDVCFKAKLAASHKKWLRWLPRYHIYQSQEAAVFDPKGHTKILVLTEAAQAVFQQQYGTSSDRFSLLPPGIEVKALQKIDKAKARAAIRQQWQITETDYLALAVGSGFHTKGFDRAIKAMGALPGYLKTKTHLFIVGGGNVASLQRLAKRQGVSSNVHLVGIVDNVGDYMAAADLLVHPARSEMAGNVLIETLVIGLPVIVNENCGFAFHIERANAGEVMPLPFNQQHLNSCFAVALRDENRRGFWSEQAVQYAKANDFANLAPRFVDIIEAHLQAVS